MDFKIYNEVLTKFYCCLQFSGFFYQKCTFMRYLFTVNFSSLNKLEVLQKEFDGLKKNLEEKKKLYLRYGK